MPRPEKGRNWLRYREQGIELEIDFDTPEACTIAMDSLARLLEQRLATRKGAPLAAAPAPLAAPTAAPAPLPLPPVAPAAVSPATAAAEPLPVAARQPLRGGPRNTDEFYAERKRRVLAFITENGPSSPATIFKQFTGWFSRAAECGTMLSDWIRQADAPVERIGYGFYRVKTTTETAAS